MAKLNNDEKILSNFFVNRIRSLARICNYETDKEIYEAVGIEQSRFSHLMKMDSMPTIAECVRISQHFDVSIDSLFSDKEEIAKANKECGIVEWEKITYKEVLSVLIDLYNKGLIRIIDKSIEDVDYYGDTYTYDEYGISLANNGIVDVLKKWKDIYDKLKEIKSDAITAAAKTAFICENDINICFYQSKDALPFLEE